MNVPVTDCPFSLAYEAQLIFASVNHGLLLLIMGLVGEMVDVGLQQDVHKGLDQAHQQPDVHHLQAGGLGQRV